MSEWYTSFNNNFSWLQVWEFLIWAMPTILMGFVPVIIAYFVTRLKGNLFLMNEFYIDGGLLFLGPALLGALVGELRTSRELFQNDLRSGFTMIVLIFVLLISSVVYTYIRTSEQKTESSDGDPYFMSFLGEVSWGVTGASAIYVISTIALHTFTISTPQGQH